MKKIFLIFVLMSCFVSLYSQSQGCTPDPQFNVAGIYPDSATNLSPAYVGQSYTENITIITPNDTDVVYGGFNINVTIDQIELTSVSGLPSIFDYSCDPPTCIFNGGTVECAELFSTSNPTLNDIGIYQIIFETTTDVSGVPIIGTTTQDDQIDYYFLEITSTTSSVNSLDTYTFELINVFPNPISDNANIKFISDKPNRVTISIYNLFGQTMDSRIVYANKGINTVNFNTLKYPDGIYLYSINNEYNSLTKRMIIQH